MNGADAAIRRCLIFSAVCSAIAVLLHPRSPLCRLVDRPVAENPTDRKALR